MKNILNFKKEVSPFVSSFFKKCSIAVSYVVIPCNMSVHVLQSGATNVSKLCLGCVSIYFYLIFIFFVGHIRDAQACLS